MSVRPLAIDIGADLLIDRNPGILKSTAASGAGTLTVYSISKFAVNQILLIGELGEEDAEIIKTHASTAPTGNTVTLASNLVKSHPKDTRVYVILYDQYEVSNASTITGAKSVLGSVTNINPEDIENIFDDSTASGGYYFIRYKNSITGTFSDYSDPIPYLGFPENAVGYVINLAMNDLGKQFTEKLTYETLIAKLNAMLRFRRGKLKRWSNAQEFDYSLGAVNRGEYRFALPDSYYDPNSNKSMLDIRIGDGDSLIYKDKREFNQMMADVVHTQVATQPLVGATSLVLDDTKDLPDSGTINVYYNNEQYSVTYTGKTDSTGTLTGIPASGDGSITATFAVDSNVWYGESEGTPYYYSVWDGYIYIWGLIAEEEAGKRLLIDFYTDIVSVDSDSDLLDNNRFDMAYYWLCWEIKNITENKGKRDLKDADFAMFTQILNDEIKQERTGQKYKFNYKLNGISYRSQSTSKGDFDRV